MRLICQSCKHELIQNVYWKNNIKYEDNVWECSEGHCALKIEGSNIVSYTVFFERSKIMYRLYADYNNGMQLASKDTSRFKRGGFKTSLTIPQYINLIIKDEIIQVEYLVDKLRKLVIFS